MKVCVLVKETPDAVAPKRIDPATGRLDRSGEPTLNPADTHAVEAALQLREGGELPIAEIVVVTMGPRSALHVLHKALSLGADRGVHLSDDALAGSDVNGTGYALARLLAGEAPGLVLLGQQSADGECYSLGAVVGEHLRMPALSQVVGLSVRGGELECERQAEYGYDTVRVPLPAVISVGDALNQPRYPSLKAIMAGRRKPVETVGIAEAGIVPERVGHLHARALCGEFHRPPERSRGRVIEDRDTAATVAEIVAWLDERRLLT